MSDAHDVTTRDLAAREGAVATDRENERGGRERTPEAERGKASEVPALLPADEGERYRSTWEDIQTAFDTNVKAATSIWMPAEKR